MLTVVHAVFLPGTVLDATTRSDRLPGRAERFGAIRLPKLADTEIFADPAGHPFCLCRPPFGPTR